MSWNRPNTLEIQPPPDNNLQDYVYFTDDKTYLLDGPSTSTHPSTNVTSPAPRHFHFNPISFAISTSFNYFHNDSPLMQYCNIIEEELSEETLTITSPEEEIVLAANHNEPNTYKQAMRSPKASNWKVAIQEELDAFEDNDV